MLKDLRTYDNLGTPQYFFELFNSINNSIVTWQIEDVERLFHNRIIGDRAIFDGCLSLAIEIEIISLDGNGVVGLNDAMRSFLRNEKQMCDKFIDMLFVSLRDDTTFHEIFSSKNISYDIIYHSIQINYSAFGFKYANFKQLLIDFDVIRIHPTPELKKFILNPRYKRIFDKIILPEIKKRKIGILELKEQLEQLHIYGEEAEKYVLHFERRRLDNKEGIDWVAEYSVAEGYDISSFHSQESLSNDRFIEVKSYSGKPYFFWSRNEVDISRIKGENYFLYLVDRSQLNDMAYQPMIIQNPYKNVLHNDKWDKTVEKFRLELRVD